ncbi:MAG: DMT family transporter [Chloroflexi bacterium]|nr:DMT family transporter [Chloroflexota bacterium]
MLGVILGLSAALGFGVAAVFARVGLQDMKPTTGTLVSLVVGTAITMALAFIFHAQAIFDLAGVAFLWFLLSAFINFPLGRLLNFTGVSLVGVSKSAPIVGSSPLFATVLAISVGGESINAMIALGTVSIIGGLVLILSQK